MTAAVEKSITGHFCEPVLPYVSRVVSKLDFEPSILDVQYPETLLTLGFGAPDPVVMVLEDVSGGVDWRQVLDPVRSHDDFLLRGLATAVPTPEADARIEQSAGQNEEQGQARMLAEEYLKCLHDDLQEGVSCGAGKQKQL
jgi:hypothetical protein